MANKDIITEEEFYAEMSRRTSKSPQKDSPGDSGVNANAEINMGIEYQPRKRRRKRDVPIFDQGHHKA